MHALRKLFGHDRVERHGGGYRLRLEEGELDVHRFEQLVERARAADDSCAEARLLREALALWRGPALADLRDAPFAEREASRLEELRLTTLERRIAADLNCGEDLGLTGELESLIADEPYRERLHGQLMLALYRAGRQAEALEAYGRARRLLVDELGMEPGPALQELERRILRQDASLLETASGAATHAPRTTNLPAAATRLIGRELEVAATTSLLRQADVRLLTLTGAGGSGKTRLAGAVAHELLDEFPGGVWFVPLASVHDPALVAPTIGRTLGVGEGGYESLHEALQAELQERITLLVLDNFEHVLPASHLVAELLAAAPGLKVLVTSRSILRLSGEHDYPVPPLPLPDPRAAGDSATLAHNPAVMLFVERASAVRPDFRLEGHERAVAEICAALDGLPLALELAAARAKVLSPEALRKRLERRLPLLVRGPSDLPGRQQTLRATIDWSYDLLDEDERRLFAALAVFAGGCTPETAESVCGGDLDTLTSLLDKSLLRRRPGSDREERFVMLETVREYAAERLEEEGEAESLRRAHGEYFVRLAEKAEPELTGVSGAAWLERLDAEHENLRAALAWAASDGEPELALRLAVALHYFWRFRGHLTEGRRWLEGALARDGDPASPARARALMATAAIVDRQGDHEGARHLLEEALDRFRALGDRALEARALAELGGIAIVEGDYEHGAQLLEETIPLFREAGDSRALMVSLGNLASVKNLQGDRERGRALGEESLALARERSDRDQTAITLHNLGRASLVEGRPDEALAPLEESLEIAGELGYRELIAYCLGGFAEIAAAGGDHERAARLLGAAEALYDELGISLGPEEQEGHERTAALLEGELGPDLLGRLRAEGRTLELEPAIAMALRARGEHPAS